MSLAGRARRIALAAAYGSGGIGLLGAGTAALLVTEARLARRWIGPITEVPPRADGLYGASYPGLPLELMILGDSSAAGLGVHDPTQTPGALLAAGLASAARLPVRLRCVARTGAQSVHLGPQVEQALLARPDVAVLMIGGNDVTHRVRPSASVRLLDEAVRRLRAAAIEVVVGTCPDLGTIEPVAQPLRYIARQWSRQLAAAQTIVVVEAGGRTVSLGDLLGPEFAARPRELFGPDRFHPSAAGYAAAATAMLPSVSAALGFALEPDEQAHGDPAAPAAIARGVRDVAHAAAEAVEQAGTEVSGTSVAGHEQGPRGRWALLRFRRRRQLPGVRQVDAAGDGGADGPDPARPDEYGDTGSREAVPSG